MRYILPLAIAALFYSSCKKDISVCSDYKQITGREKSADISTISSKAIRDTLAKYPQLVPYQIRNDQYFCQVACHAYYKDLLIFSDAYNLYQQHFNNDTITSDGKLLKSDPGISLTPGIGYEQAVKEAKKYVNFDHSCIAYQLGVYDVNRWNPPASYKLAWKIMDDQKTYMYVIVDAVTGKMIITDNGIRWAD